jgi:C-terminal processing protease CtpA/Prc
MTWDVGKNVSLDVLTSSGVARKVSMSTGVTRQDPPLSRVITTPEGKNVGYLYLNSFDDFLSRQIKTHFTTFKREGVRDLVLDLRYNPGGIIDNAALLANLIAGSKRSGKHFATVQHSQRHSDRDYEYIFESLPESLSTRRLVVLTTQETCSASEVVINWLKPYMPVYTVGSTTCGKPYMMHGVRFGDKILFPVTARVLNSRGDGHYISGIRADYKAEDDLTHQLGDPQEGMLKKALEVLDKDFL